MGKVHWIWEVFLIKEMSFHVSQAYSFMITALYDSGKIGICRRIIIKKQGNSGKKKVQYYRLSVPG